MSRQSSVFGDDVWAMYIPSADVSVSRIVDSRELRGVNGELVVVDFDCDGNICGVEIVFKVVEMSDEIFVDVPDGRVGLPDDLILSDDLRWPRLMEMTKAN